uniref:hypothetical protein n=1 Tax=Halorussus marinus TaxID=2505976 RepID=UPI001FCEB025|nr:hypothetical protein [Halorussus marinus]
MLHARLSTNRGHDPTEKFLDELKEKHRVEDVEFLVDGMDYLIALARTNLDGHLDYSERNLVEMLFQTLTMQIARFHETWNGSQISAERRLTATRLLQSPPQSLSTPEPATDRSSQIDLNLVVPHLP